MKLVAIYAEPKDPQGFEQMYLDTHVPLLKKVPGLQEIQVTRIDKVVVGYKAPYMIAQMTFANEDALKAAMRSPEMTAAGENLDSFAKGLYTLCYAQEK
jgi:uncharacterized protein (TIGR02118 family)